MPRTPTQPAERPPQPHPSATAKPRSPRPWWPLALALALAFHALVTWERRTTAEALNSLTGPGAPVLPSDPASPTGHPHGQRADLLPYVDGYHWVMHTQHMLATGDARVRHVAYDNAPDGRAVHWSLPFRAWLAALAWIHHAATGTPLTASVERVAPWASPILFTLLLLAVTPLIARRFGHLAAALAAPALVAVQPLNEFFIYGNPDHHGLAAACALLTVLGLQPKGSNPNVCGPASSETPLPSRAGLLASALFSALGLWISAATQIPVLAGVALAGLLAAALQPAASDARPLAAVWRLWSRTGAAAALLCYFVEYGFGSLVLRLEVNHPLYALAWFGTGELLAQATLLLAARPARLPRTPRQLAALLLALAAIASPLVVALLSPGAFAMSDPFLLAFHKRHIIEFKSLLQYLADTPFRPALSWIGALPALLLPALLCLRRATPAEKRALLLALPPALVLTALALVQIRWFGIACALLIVPLCLVARRAARGWASGSRLTTALLCAPAALLLLVPFPAETVARSLHTARGNIAPTQENFAAVVVRDVAHWLRARAGSAPVVALSGPVATTSLIYHGGHTGVGTLYWENARGLRTAMEIFAAENADRAKQLVLAHRITHLVIFSWDAFADQSVELLRAHDPDAKTGGFLRQLLGADALPPWLTPLWYPPPHQFTLKNHFVLVLEVTPQQTPREARLRSAQYLLSAGLNAEARADLAPVLAETPSDPSALILAATLAALQNDAPAFTSLLEKILASPAVRSGTLPLEDRIDLTTLLVQANLLDRAREEIVAALALADETSLRRLRADALLSFLEHAAALNVPRTRPEILPLAVALLPRPLRDELQNASTAPRP